jgi:hypothetical protein
MKIARIWSDDTGTSHFADLEIELVDQGAIGRLSEPIPARAVLLRENDADYDYDWHAAPRRQLVVLLDGAIEIEVGDGECRTFRGGDVLLLEDTTGRGHRTRNVTATPRRSLFIALG